MVVSDHKEEAETTDEAQAKEGSTTDQEKCTMQFAVIAAKNVKYRSNLQKVKKYVVLNVTKKAEDSNSIFFYLFFYSLPASG